VRAALLLLLVVAVLVMLLPLLRRRLPAAPTTALGRDELVKDPVCHTYVVRSRAVRRTEHGEPRYFCSAECARRYAIDPPPPGGA
jgi:YHS domain-containing protein